MSTMKSYHSPAKLSVHSFHTGAALDGESFSELKRVLLVHETVKIVLESQRSIFLFTTSGLVAVRFDSNDQKDQKNKRRLIQRIDFAS
ncbi:UNVERIFIED_CONTAM: hypothetical protein HDU68_007892, partial [Siphonaria sp. JEL0065]